MCHSRVALAFLIVTGCAAPPIQKAPTANPDLVIEGRRLIANARAEDKNLWRYRVVMEALKRGQFVEARTLLDETLPDISMLRALDPKARSTHRLFTPESAKTFVGEPFERAMAYYHRGILYWMDGELDNARACFRTAQLFDADAQKEAFACDYLLLDYLDGYVSAKLGADGSDSLKRARANAKQITLPDFDVSANVIVFLQMGFGPVKTTVGRNGERLAFQEGHSTAVAAEVRIDGVKTRTAPWDNLTYQAVTRGGRLMELILRDKSRIKTTGDIIGDLTFEPGLILTLPESTQNIGFALVGTAFLAKAVAGSTETRADTRTWNNLPQFLAFTAMRAQPGPQQIEIEFFDAANKSLPAMKRTLAIEVKSRGDTVLFVADK